MVENLRKRMVVCVSWCYMCKEAGEVVDHLLLKQKHTQCSPTIRAGEGRMYVDYTLTFVG